MKRTNIELHKTYVEARTKYLAAQITELLKDTDAIHQNVITTLRAIDRCDAENSHRDEIGIAEAVIRQMVRDLMRATDNETENEAVLELYEIEIQDYWHEDFEMHMGELEIPFELYEGLVD